MTKKLSTEAAILAAAKECFVSERTIAVSPFIKALQDRKVDTCNKLTRIVESTDYLKLKKGNNVVMLTRNIFEAETEKNTAPPPIVHPSAVRVINAITTVSPPVVNKPAVHTIESATAIPPLFVNCDTDAIVDILGDIAIEHLDLEDNGVTDIFIDVGCNMSVKVGGECVHNRVIFGHTLHRLAAVTYDGVINGITIRVGRSVSGLLPVFEGLIEDKNILLCGAPNVGKTTTLREICKYLSRGRCLCLIDSSGEVCGDTGNKGHIVGTSRVFRPVDPDQQYKTLLDCVRNHSPDVIAIDELNTKHEVEVCQTIALRSIQMVASVHGNIQDLVFNPMLNKALGGSTEALVSDRLAVDGRKVVMQRTTRPIFDVVINITRTADGLKYLFIEDVAENVSRIMQGKPIQIRTRRIVGDELLEMKEEVLFPLE
ncbi:hypothetical protein BG000_005138 [Podila horticola]|nr:hypothetical protein BG000_005138 [Podila horticola]